jgi:CHAD domain-containing protein
VTPNIHLEREAKLFADGEFALPDLNRLVDGSTAMPGGTQVLHATYFDSPDLRLIRSGITLRYRLEDDAAGCWTLKLPVEGSGRGAMARTEHTVAGDRAPGDPVAVPEELADLVRVHVRGQPLEPVALLDTERRRVRLLGRDGECLAEIDDDEVTVVRGPAAGSRFREIEVELCAGGPDVLRRATKRLIRAGAQRGEPLPKAARALGPLAQSAPEVTVEPSLPRDAPLRRLVQRAIASGLARLMRHDPGVRSGDDPEDVHQARVAMRRLRSDLRTFREALDPGWVKATRDELRWLGRALGEVRDRDVLIERLRADAASLPPPDQVAGHLLLSRLEGERATARQAALDAMRSDRYLALVEELVGAARNPPPGELVAQPARQVVRGLVRRTWRRLARGVASLPEEPDDGQLHRIRILAKRCRYAAEAVAPVAGKPAERLASAVSGVQTVLGDLHDSAVAQEWLRRAIGRSPAQAVAAGQLIAIERRRAQGLRQAWPRSWRAAKRKKLRAWLER